MGYGDEDPWAPPPGVAPRAPSLEDRRREQQAALDAAADAAGRERVANRERAQRLAERARTACAAALVGRPDGHSRYEPPPPGTPAGRLWRAASSVERADASVEELDLIEAWGGQIPSWQRELEGVD